MSLLAFYSWQDLDTGSKDLRASTRNAGFADSMKVAQVDTLALPSVACFGMNWPLMHQVEEGCFGMGSVDRVDTWDT